MNKNICCLMLVILPLISGISFSMDEDKEPLGKPLQYSLKLSRQFWEHARAGNYNEMIELILNNENLIGVNYIHSTNNYPESVTAYDFTIHRGNSETAAFLCSFGACPILSKYPYFVFINSIIEGTIPKDLPLHFEKYINFIWQGLTALDWAILFGNEKMAKFIVGLNASARTCLFDENDFAERFPLLWNEITNKPQQLLIPKISKTKAQNNPKSIEFKYAKLKKRYNKQKDLINKQFIALNAQFNQNYDCKICFDEGNFVSLPCGHVFGEKCAALLKECATCKSPFTQKRLRKIYFN